MKRQMVHNAPQCSRCGTQSACGCRGARQAPATVNGMLIPDALLPFVGNVGPATAPAAETTTTGEESKLATVAQALGLDATPDDGEEFRVKLVAALRSLADSLEAGAEPVGNVYGRTFGEAELPPFGQLVPRGVKKAPARRPTARGVSNARGVTYDEGEAYLAPFFDR